MEERLVEVGEELLGLKLVVPVAGVQEHCERPGRRLMEVLQVEEEEEQLTAQEQREGEAELVLLLEAEEVVPLG